MTAIGAMDGYTVELSGEEFLRVFEIVLASM
jgi:hypothetical protein